MNKSEKPKLIHCQEGTKKDIYEVLINEGPFKDKTLKDIFMIAMALGFKHNVRVPIKKQEWLFRTDQLPDNSEDYWIFKSIAISTEKDLNVLLDEKKICNIAQEYANGGISLLKEKVFSSSDFANFNKRFESELRDILNELLVNNE